MFPADIVVFDGVCNFCNGVVNFIIKRDTERLFHFTPIQSTAGISLLQQHNIATTEIETFVVIRDKRSYVKSDAALVIAKELGAPWRWLTVFRYVPKPLRDGIYSLIARHRYKLFGKRSQCMHPTQEQKTRFIP